MLNAPTLGNALSIMKAVIKMAVKTEVNKITASLRLNTFTRIKQNVVRENAQKLIKQSHSNHWNLISVVTATKSSVASTTRAIFLIMPDKSKFLYFTNIAIIPA